MVVIKKRDNVIPVEFGEFTLEFIGNDQNIHKMEKLGKILKEEGEKVANAEDDKAFEAYQKVYDFSNGPTVDTMAYLLETINGVISEWEQRNNTDALKKYLGD